MDVASIQAELHRYYDKLIAGICLIGMDPILFVNRGCWICTIAVMKGSSIASRGKSARG